MVVMGCGEIVRMADEENTNGGVPYHHWSRESISDTTDVGGRYPITKVTNDARK